MFEDFKDKVREHSQNEPKPLSASLSPQVLEKLKKEGIDPDNFTLKQLWPEVLDEDGNDLIVNVWCRMGNHGNIC